MEKRPETILKASFRAVLGQSKVAKSQSETITWGWLMFSGSDDGWWSARVDGWWCLLCFRNQSYSWSPMVVVWCLFSSHFWQVQGHAGCIKAVNFSQHAKAGQPSNQPSIVAVWDSYLCIYLYLYLYTCIYIYRYLYISISLYLYISISLSICSDPFLGLGGPIILTGSCLDSWQGLASGVALWSQQWVKSVSKHVGLWGLVMSTQNNAFPSVEWFYQYIYIYVYIYIYNYIYICV